MPSLPHFAPDPGTPDPGRARPRRLSARPLHFLRSSWRPVPRPRAGRPSTQAFLTSLRDPRTPGPGRARPRRLPARPLRSPTIDSATCTAPSGRASRRASPTSKISRSPNAWRKPSPTAPTTSATSPFPTTRSATCIATSGRASRHARPTSSLSRSASAWPKPSPTAPTTSATSPSSYNKVGDLYRDLGQGEQARQAFLNARSRFAERLAQAEPDRADYQRDLSVSYERVGDLYRDLGQGERGTRVLHERSRDRRAPGTSRARPRRLPA